MDKLIITMHISELKILIENIIDQKIQKITASEIVKSVNDLPKFMTRQEVADLFGVSLVSVDKWKKHGILPTPIKQSGRTYFLRMDIDKMIKDKIELNKLKP